MDAADATAVINGPAGYSPWWWVALAITVVGIVVLWWWNRSLARRAAPGAGDALEQLRAETLAAVEKAAGLGAVGEMLHQVRRFVGITGDVDADYVTLPELRRAAVKDPRLDDVVQLVEELTPGLFDGRTPLDVDAARARCVQVVTGWI